MAAKLTPSSWQIVIDKIMYGKTNIECLSAGDPEIEKLKKKLKFRELSIEDLKLDLPIPTEELGYYRPISDIVSSPKTISHYALGSKIIYNVDKISLHADKALQQVCKIMEVDKPPEELVRLFRWAFSHVVRRHMLFHYLVERGSRLLPEDRYWEYRAKIYERKEVATQGLLEEALADAYAIVYSEDDIKAIPSPASTPVPREDLIIGFKKMLKALFINDTRPPGYREAKNFILEFENLKDTDSVEAIQNLLLVSAIMKGTTSIDGVFRGLSWLYRELTFLETSDPSKKPLPPAPPYPSKNFLLFVENFRKDPTLLLLLILPPVEEAFSEQEAIRRPPQAQM